MSGLVTNTIYTLLLTLLFSPLTVLFFVSFEGKIGEGKLMIVQCPLDIATGLRQGVCGRYRQRGRYIKGL